MAKKFCSGGNLSCEISWLRSSAISLDGDGSQWIFFFFECLYFSENDIRTLLFVFWLRNRPFIKYVRNCTGAYRYWGVEKSVTRYVRTKWITRNKCCGIFFVYWFGQVHKSITTSKKNVVIFFHHNYDCFILCNN